MKRFLKSLALLVLIAGLPLQNLHALAMPLCDQDKDSTAFHDHSGHDTEMAGHDHDGPQQTSPDTSLACDSCSMCHACSAPAIASAGVIDLPLDVPAAPPIFLPTHIFLFDPEQPQRPPLQF